MNIYVNVQAFRDGVGTQERPFRSISEAAKIARPGDTVLVAPGIYREYVNPVFGGTEDAPIVYRSTEPLGAVISGAEAFMILPSFTFPQSFKGSRSDFSSSPPMYGMTLSTISGHVSKFLPAPDMA